MTPMVDLGFLLITFFIFSAEISKPAVLNLHVPHDGTPTPVSRSKSLTILLGGMNRVFYYHGMFDQAIKNKQVFQTTYDELTGLGKIIRQKQMDLASNGISRKEMVVLIKPGNECSYRNLVSTLDEMLINGVTRYALADPETDEAALIATRK